MTCIGRTRYYTAISYKRLPACANCRFAPVIGPWDILVTYRHATRANLPLPCNNRNWLLGPPSNGWHFLHITNSLKKTLYAWSGLFSSNNLQDILRELLLCLKGHNTSAGITHLTILASALSRDFRSTSALLNRKIGAFDRRFTYNKSDELL